MGVIQKQLTSTSGFRSPGFSVDGNGGFSIASLNATDSLKINGQDVLTNTTLANSVVNSNLTKVGTLTGLTVNSTTDIGLTTLAALNITSNNVSVNSTTISITTTGAIVLNSGALGSIENITIGLNTPAEAQFTSVVATESIFVGSQNIKALSAALAVALS